MHPQGMFGLDALRLLLTPVALFGITFFVLYLRQEGVRAGRLLLLLLGTFLAALLGAKLFSLLVRDWAVYQPLTAELRGGWRYPGALLAMALLTPLMKRALLPELPVGRFLDVLAITVCFSFALIRISCYMSGCCTGVRCDEAYCLAFAPGSQVWYNHLQAGLLPSPSARSLPVLPLHFLFMAASFAVGLFLLWFDRRRQYNGQLALLYLLLHDGLKGLLESWREPYVAELQITSLSISATGLVALVAIAILRRKRAPATQRQADQAEAK